MVEILAFLEKPLTIVAETSRFLSLVLIITRSQSGRRNYSTFKLMISIYNIFIFNSKEIHLNTRLTKIKIPVLATAPVLISSHHFMF